MKALVDMMKRSMATCEEVSRLTSESMDRRLTLRERVRRQLHLMFCKWCRRYSRQLGIIRKLTRRFAAATDSPPAQPPTHLSPEAKDRLRESLKNR